MTLDTLPRKFVLAILIAFGSIVWLNQWHRYIYTRSRIDFPRVSNNLRDTIIILIPVVLAVWIGVALSQWVINRFSGRMSPATQSILAAGILGGITSITITLTESIRNIGTGLATEFIFLASICNKVYPNGNLLLDALKWVFPDARALKFHILLRDGANLMIFNLAVIILVIMLMEGFSIVRNRNTFTPDAV